MAFTSRKEIPMSTPIRRVQLLLVATLVAVVGLVSARPAAAVLRIWETFYYSDATLTTQVGYCYDNPCTGVSYCTGQITIYNRDHLVGTCIPQGSPASSSSMTTSAPWSTTSPRVGLSPAPGLCR